MIKVYCRAPFMLGHTKIELPLCCIVHIYEVMKLKKLLNSISPFFPLPQYTPFDHIYKQENNFFRFIEYRLYTLVIQ